MRLVKLLPVSASVILALAGCGGGAPAGSPAAEEQSALNSCAVCRAENPDSYDACVQVCTAAGLWGSGSSDKRAY